jgi:hypothetical protein
MFNEDKDLVVMLQSCHLNLIVSSESEHAATHISNYTSGMLNISIASVDSDTEPLLQQTVHSNDDENEIRSRNKAASFHQINKVPLKRGSPAAPYICALLTAATLDFDNEDYKHVCAYLSVKGINDHVDHYFHNKEFWRKHIQMICPKRNEHATASLHSKNMLESILMNICAHTWKSANEETTTPCPMSPFTATVKDLPMVYTCIGGYAGQEPKMLIKK